MSAKNSFGSEQELKVGNKSYTIYNLDVAAKAMGINPKQLPKSMKVLLENLLRYEDGRTVHKEDITAIGEWLKTKQSDKEIAYRQARVLMQDFTGVPAVVDLAAMRDAMVKLGGNPQQINPIAEVDLVIDHSVMVDKAGSARSFYDNVQFEYDRNRERYAFLRWGQQAFTNFRVVPPGTGICHQVNLEYLAQVVWTRENQGKTYAFPDTLVGTDSHTTMINGLAVLGWGVGGIEAEAVMLGQPTSMLIPEVVGMRLDGKLKEGTTATDLVLTITQMLRKHGVVNKFVEFYGPGLKELSLANRATVANMAPEYGATCGFFPIDNETIRYLKFSGRDADRIALVEAYAKIQGLWLEDGDEPSFSSTLTLDMSTVEPSLAGPKRPQDRVTLSSAAAEFKTLLNTEVGEPRIVSVDGHDHEVKDGDVVIAAITSCTNTSNPSVMMAAGLLAKKAREKGLKTKPWVKASLAPGSQVVTDYFNKAGLQVYLDELGFNLVGYGCTTCIGNSGPLEEHITAAIQSSDLMVAAVLSGNRNFEGRVHPLTKANYLMSPPLVVAYALAGNMMVDLTKDPIGEGSDGAPVYLKDIWPSNAEVEATVQQNLDADMFKTRYAKVFEGDQSWQAIESPKGQTYTWDNDSTYVQNPPYFDRLVKEVSGVYDIKKAHVLALLGDSVTTDHISPAGDIKKTGPAGKYLAEHGVEPIDFNSFGARRGNHEIMMRGTFANIRLQNEMTPETAGGVTVYVPSNEQMSIYDASMKYHMTRIPLVVIGGKEYGTGSSRDWAAKGTKLLGVKAVIVESFERIHRSNLVGMGILPLQFKAGETRKTLGLTGFETFDILGVEKGLQPLQDLDVVITYADGKTKNIKVLCRIDTADEIDYYKNGGILPYVLRSMAG